MFLTGETCVFILLTKPLFPDILGLIKPCKISGLRGWKFRGVTLLTMDEVFPRLNRRFTQSETPWNFFVDFGEGPIPNPNTNRPYRAHILPKCSWNPEVSTSIFEGLFPQKTRSFPTKTRVIKGFRVLLKKKIEDNNHQPTVTVTGNSGLSYGCKGSCQRGKGRPWQVLTEDLLQTKSCVNLQKVIWFLGPPI